MVSSVCIDSNIKSDKFSGFQTSGFRFCKVNLWDQSFLDNSWFKTLLVPMIFS